MELIVKLQNEGFSRIGVKYAQEYSAVNSYEELFSKEEGNSFGLSIELVKDKLNLSLISDTNGIKTHYKDISYSQEQLKKLVLALNTFKNFQFMHVYSKNNIVMVAKPFRKSLFINLSKIEILNPINL